MAIALQAPELQLQQEEAEQYAKAVASVARHYDMGASAKTLDWINLCTTMGSIYGVRAMAIVARKRNPRRQDHPAPMANGHDPAPVRVDPAEAEQTVDWSLMRGRPN